MGIIKPFQFNIKSCELLFHLFLVQEIDAVNYQCIISWSCGGV